MGITVSHASSLTNADNPLYAIKPSDWNSSHIFTLNAVGSEISGAFGNGGGVSFGLSADGKVTAAAPAGAPSPINFSAGTTSSNIGSVVFSDSNGLGWGLNGSTITGSYTQSTHSHSSLFFGDSNGLNWGTNASTVTGSYTQSTHAHTAWPVAFSAGTQTATSGTPGLANSNNFTFGMSGSSQITASFSESTHAHSAWPLGLSAGTQTATSGTPGFADSNGITWGMSGSSQITASYSQSTHVHQLTMFATSNTTQSSSGTTNVSNLVFAGAGVASVGITGGSVVISVPAGGGAALGAGISNTGNTAGNTGTVSSGTIVFAGSGGITASESTAAGQSTLWFSVANPVAQTNQTVGLYALGNTTQNSSTTLDARTMSFNGLGAATWGYSNGSIQVSVPATSSLVGTSGLSVSTAGSTISVLPIALSAWDPYPILTGTATSSHAPASFWFSRMVLDWDVAVSYANVLKSLNVSAPGASSQNSSLTNKFSYSHGLTLFTRQNFGANSSNMSQWTTASFGMTGSLSQSSSSASVALSWVTNSTGGTTSFSTTSGSNLWTNFFTGMQMFRIPLVTTLTPGEYFIGQAHSSTTGTVGSNFTLLSVSNLHVAPQSNTFATITSSGSLGASSPDGLGIGVASAVTTNNTMAMSVVSAGTQNWWYMNFSNI
jgi:hypothetical protein